MKRLLVYMAIGLPIYIIAAMISHSFGCGWIAGSIYTIGTYIYDKKTKN